MEGRTVIMTNPVHPSSGNGQPTDSRMIILIRHAEKPLHPSGSPHGVNPEGVEDPRFTQIPQLLLPGDLRYPIETLASPR
jgi:hypothetical protein